MLGTNLKNFEVKKYISNFTHFFCTLTRTSVKPGDVSYISLIEEVMLIGGL